LRLLTPAGTVAIYALVAPWLRREGVLEVGGPPGVTEAAAGVIQKGGNSEFMFILKSRILIPFIYPNIIMYL